MINSRDQFGRNAGRIWEVLSAEKALPIDKIMEKTHLRLYEVEIGIGWLARENKVAYENGEYILRPTNLTNSIGTNAGIIWNALENTGTGNVHSLIKHCSLPTQEIYKAIGWLAREEKINLNLR
jgi:hypothetical protein